MSRKGERGRHHKNRLLGGLDMLDRSSDSSSESEGEFTPGTNSSTSPTVITNISTVSPTTSAGSSSPFSTSPYISPATTRPGSASGVRTSTSFLATTTTDSRSAMVANESLGPHIREIAVLAKAGRDSITCARLNEIMVQVGTEKFGFQNDYDHPNTLYILHKDEGGAGVKGIQTANRIAYCHGAEIVVKIIDGQICVTNHAISGKNLTTYVASRPVNDESLREVAEKVIELSLKPRGPEEEPRLKNANPGGISDLTLPSEVENSLEENSETREVRVDCFRESGFDLKGKVKKFILGGAGPAASAAFFMSTVRKAEKDGALDDFFIAHLSLTNCPGKYPYLSGKGPSFLKFYTEEVYFFTDLLGVEKVVTPCNTNHILMREDLVNGGPGWAADHMDKIVDYRDALVSELKERGVKKVLLLGTEATTTTHKLYHEVLKKAGIEIVTANEDGQKLVTEAIYDVKAGRMKKAQGLIEGVVKKYGRDVTVVLACTELPLPFEEKQIIDNGWVCVSDAAVKFMSKISLHKKDPDSKIQPSEASTLSSPSEKVTAVGL